MQRSSKKGNYRMAASLRAIPGRIKEEEVSSLSRIAWLFLSSCLWNGTQFSQKEKEATQEEIGDYLRHTHNRRRAFLSFCERILVSRHCAAPPPLDSVLPSDWLDSGNPNGFAASKIPFLHMKSLRQSLPLYRYSWKALAEAVLEFGEEPTAEHFRYWKSYFTEKQEPELLQLFQVFVSNCHFSN